MHPRHPCASCTNHSSPLVSPSQLLRYGQGEYYATHHDESLGRNLSAPSGGRMLTLLVYLGGNGLEGGGTHFPRLGLTVQPKLGRGLLWPNCRDDLRSVEPRTWHAAEAVTAGTKFAMNLWQHYGPWDEAQATRG